MDKSNSPTLYVAVVKGETEHPSAAWTAYVSVNRDEAQFSAMAAKVRQSGKDPGFRIYMGTLTEVIEIPVIRTNSLKGQTHLIDSKTRPRRRKE